MPTPPAVPDDSAQALRALLAAGRFQDALELHRGLADRPDAGREDVQLLAATAATRLGELDLGTSLADKALQRYRRRGDRDGRMRSLNLLGAIYFERGNMRDAEQRFAEALRLGRQLGDSLMLARACNNLASVALLQGRSDDAAELYRGALLAYQRLGDRRGMAETYHNLGIVYRWAGNRLEAEDAANDAVRHATVVGEGSLLALVLTGRAELSVERGDPALAVRELERAGRLAREASDVIGAAEVTRVEALAALRQENWQGALAHAEGARAVALAHQSVQLAAECAGIAARALRELGRSKEAKARRSEAEEGFRELGATFLLQRLEQEWKS
ncbi:MAG: tetratricopeptide repeat protein [Gemmatimonadales bacterium]